MYIIPFYDTSFFKYKNYFQGFFLPDDYSLDITTLQQQSQDPVLRTVYSWIVKNEKPETLTPLITGTPFLHAYYKRFSQLLIDDSTNLITLYNKHPPTQNQSSTPDFVHATIRICLPFRLFKTVLTNFMNTLIQVSKSHMIHSRNITTFHSLKNYRISMDTKGPINPPSHNKSYIHVIIDAFSHFVVTVPIKSNNAKTAIKTLLHH